MRLSVLVVATALAGCTPPASPGVSLERVVARDERGDAIRTTNTTSAVQSEFAEPVARVYRALTDVYATLGIEVLVADPARGRIGNASFTFPRRMLNWAPSRFIECGSTMTGLLADEARVLASVVTSIAPRPGGGSVVGTTVQASARSMKGASTADVTCASTGVLEARIRDLLAERLARGG